MHNALTTGDRPAHEGGLRQIDLEAGAQAIQASAATAVQNVLRSLKESDKSILNQEQVLLFTVLLYVKEVVTRVAPDTELAGYPAAGYPANLFCRISGIRPDIRLNT